MAWTKTGTGQVREDGKVRFQRSQQLEAGRGSHRARRVGGMRRTWEQGPGAAKHNSSSQRTEAAAGGLRACLFSASGDVSVSPQGGFQTIRFTFFVLYPKAKPQLSRVRKRAGDGFPQPRGGPRRHAGPPVSPHSPLHPNSPPNLPPPRTHAHWSCHHR